ncbi:MAG: hypothetical protein B1H03_04095 [Planctomycetales bacterium 4484_113]|nr:MAG: hypothetical protein B1H03_04095 [Planctomycetales bacterium 4484_113]
MLSQRTLLALTAVMAVAAFIAAASLSITARAASRDMSCARDVLPENIPDFNRAEDNALLVRELRHGNPGLREVALTFDDGPHPLYTARILAILHYYRVPATFFMVGVQGARYPQWVKMVFQEGHEIGNQTYDHFRLVHLPYSEQVYQIEEFQRLIFKLTGVYPRFLRPPGGQYNAQTIELMNRNGLALGLWSVNSKDVADVDAETMYRSILRDTENGSIILMHDGSPATLEMLPALIETLTRRGYTFVTMSQMLAHARPEVLRRPLGETSAPPPASPEEPKKGHWKIISY